ncbi:MAG: ATP-dependent DNA helicase [Chitinophagales bacterium]|nr:MAG: ATP-dependent DNA helicase [Chitinophagales bacterium]
MLHNIFHPAVARWFENTFQAPTEVQLKAWAEIKKHRHVLIAAPTGSGKTLAAFLAAIDDLIRQTPEKSYKAATRVVYVSPLKALSNDIHLNLKMPLRGIAEELEKAGCHPPEIHVMVRTGDTPPSVRTAMAKNPPHILVTTPESLYLLLTSVSGRKMLSATQTLIIDEIHALVGNKRGSHLALSVERLQELCDKPLQRIGLSATQQPLELVARFLTGSPKADSENTDLSPCSIVNTGHSRTLDLALELPRSPLTAVMSNEVWGEIYDRMEELIRQHKTTLIFVNTRRLAERLAHQLTAQLGEDVVTAHHGSMAKEQRHDAEQRLKRGNLRALVATASLELGIDIGSVELVIQIGSPRSIATFLQRVGRSGHTVFGTPKGRLFPLSLDDLLECTALLDCIRHGELDNILIPEKPLDILSQQIVAEVACCPYQTEDLYQLVRRAYPYRNLSRPEFDQIIKMLAEGFTTRLGRRAAYLQYDMVNQRVHARKGARLTALVSGGAIPDNFDYDVVLEPENITIGTLNEDFAIESMEGDIFQLGNTSWRILRVENGKVRVEDAKGQPPTIPFWFGEAPGRSVELSEAVSRLKETISSRLGDLSSLTPAAHGTETSEASWKQEAVAFLMQELQLPSVAAEQLVSYLAAGQAALGAMPTHNTLVMERFFDEAGDMHLIIHSDYGVRINRAWGLALRKRFCKKFNFELQAAATENAIILSLGATHSFPLAEVFDYLSPETVRHILTQALLDSPMFEIRWRWNATRALAVLRRRAGKKVPPQIQRSQAEDLIALIFPDQLACFENIQGEREIPDHPLVNQTIYDCLYEAMDIENLERLLEKIKNREISLIARDLREPSPFAAEILNARPYAFLDDAPLEERRTRAVQNRRWLDPAAAKDLGKLDLEAIQTVKAEAWPQADTPDALHDALMLFSCFTDAEIVHEGWEHLLHQLIDQKRATSFHLPHQRLWFAAERIPQMQAVFPESKLMPEIPAPDMLRNQTCSSEEALKELVRGRLEAVGPTTAADLAATFCLNQTTIESALVLLENEGFVFRGHFTPDRHEEEWCERRLLARIHRYTLSKLRKEIEPVSISMFMQFLFAWHHLDPAFRQEGPLALEKIIAQLEGFEAQAAAWESDILPSRVANYDFQWLDALCLSGKLLWGRFRAQRSESVPPKAAAPVKTTPITFISRQNLPVWKEMTEERKIPFPQDLSPLARRVTELLNNQGATFFHDLVNKTQSLPLQVEKALAELVASGLVTADSYTGLRALLAPARFASGRALRPSFSMEQAGRWSLIDYNCEAADTSPSGQRKKLETIIKILLKRYGIVFRRLAEREYLIPPWWELVRVLRLMEARGDVRGGRFVEGVYGEQYALPEAVSLLRKIRKEGKTGSLIAVSAADPLNLTGMVLPHKRVPAVYTNRLLFRDGRLIAVKEGKDIHIMEESDPAAAWKIRNALIQRNVSPKLKAYLGKGMS